MGEDEEAIKIFYCYARADKKLKEQLERHLEAIKHKHPVVMFSDIEILPGKKWEKEIEKSLYTSDILLALTSANFISSIYGYNVELQKALKRAEEGKVLIIPIILRHCAWRSTPLGKIQSLPAGAKPVMAWDNVDEAFYDIYQGIEKVVEDIQDKKPLIYDFDRIYEKKGRVTEARFQGQDITSSFLEFLQSFSPIQYYTCFISYSHEDQDLAQRLHNDLQANGVRCWFAPHDLLPGMYIRSSIDESIRVYDKFLLLLSHNSVKSSWVRFEVETALQKEIHKHREVLFPIRLDDSILAVSESWAAALRSSRHISDFTEWRNHDKYQEAFNKLLKDLKLSTQISPNSPFEKLI